MSQPLENSLEVGTLYSYTSIVGIIKSIYTLGIINSSPILEHIIVKVDSLIRNPHDS